jgi:hypothetical protein
MITHAVSCGSGARLAPVSTRHEAPRSGMPHILPHYPSAVHKTLGKCPSLSEEFSHFFRVARVFRGQFFNSGFFNYEPHESKIEPLRTG